LLLAHGIGQSAEPVAATSPRAAATLAMLTHLSQDSTPGTLCGQNLGHANEDPEGGYRLFVERLFRESGKWPAVLGADYGFNQIPSNLERTNRILIDYFQAGGLVMVSMHPPNPWHNTECRDLRCGAVHELWQPGTPACQRWRQTLARAADGLAQLRDAGVIVLWRPLHEMNGGWFWWGFQERGKWMPRDDFVQLWQGMFRYLTEERQLDNLLWVYAPAVQTSSELKPVLHYYPGDQFVDIVGLDWYSDKLTELDSHGSYQQLRSLHKPLGLTEFGPERQRDGSFDNLTLVSALQSRYPGIGFFMFWHSWPAARIAIVDQRRARALMRHPYVLSRDAARQDIHDAK
jgi:mannan endo-1,4-beta-mannosidase